MAFIGAYGGNDMTDVLKDGSATVKYSEISVDGKKNNLLITRLGWRGSETE